MVKISVIIPVYNREKYIEECLNSVLEQTLKEIEIICVDDGSTDRSYDILIDYSSKYGNVIVLHQENKGSGAARNKGIEYAHGKYVCFMDSDDYYAQDCALENLYLSAEKNCALVCGGNFYSFWENGEIKKESHWFLENQLIFFKDDGDFFHYTSYIFNLELIRKNNITFPSYRRFQDPPFFLKIMSCAQEFYAINEPIYAYRQWERELKWTVDIVVDILKGIYECFQIAKKNNFVKAYEKYLKNILNDYFSIIYPQVNQGQIWELIDKINGINMEWMGECSEIFQNRESLKAYVTSLKEKRDHMIYACQKAEEVVIYGAGEVGKYFLQNFAKECKYIAGFAVSSKGMEDCIAGYAVREIGEYNRKSLIIVAVGQKYATEILQNLKKMRFENVCYTEYAVLKLLEKIQT